MKFAGYRKAIQWIAVNDDPANTDLEEIAGTLTVVFLADMVGKDSQDVAKAVLRYRAKVDWEKVH